MKPYCETDLGKLYHGDCLEVMKDIEDERNLWPEMLRIIRLCKPVWVVAENVSGVAPYIKEVVKPDLGNEGYEVWPFSISAATMGAPHKRERIWIVAYPRLQRSQKHEEQTAGIKQYNQDMAYPSIERERKLSIRQGGSQQTPTDIERGSQNVAYTNSSRNTQSRLQQSSISTKSSQDVSNTFGEYDDNTGYGAGKIRRKRSEKTEIQRSVSDTTEQRLQRGKPTKEDKRKQGLFTECCGWEFEPNVGRLAHGVSNRVDRLKALGNSIVPQIAELLFRQIKDLM